MKRKKFCCSLLLIIACALSGCDPSQDNRDGDQMSYLLCRTQWNSIFTDYTGVKCEQEFTFNSSGNGREVFRRYNPGLTETDIYTFYWYWTSDYFDAICMEYGPDNVSYLEVVEVSYNRLRGYLDGVYVEFVPY